MARFNHVINDEFEAITVYLEGDLHTVDNNHPRFTDILHRLRIDETDGLLDLFSPVKEINTAFEKLSSQVAIRGGTILFEGEPMENALAEHIIRLYEEGDKDAYGAFAKFLEKLYTNPSKDSREMLYNWLSVAEFTINSDGDIVGYKGVRREGGDYLSLHSGNGIVDGVEYFNTQLKNNPGSTVEMNRSEVTFDPNNSCAYGLHIGTWQYARGFGDYVLEVTVNPRDVVSVPAYEHAKLRACRYQVIDVLDEKYKEAYIASTSNADEVVVESFSGPAPEIIPAPDTPIYAYIADQVPVDSDW